MPAATMMLVPVKPTCTPSCVIPIVPLLRIPPENVGTVST